MDSSSAWVYLGFLSSGEIFPFHCRETLLTWRKDLSTMSMCLRVYLPVAIVEARRFEPLVCGASRGVLTNERVEVGRAAMCPMGT